MPMYTLTAPMMSAFPDRDDSQTDVRAAREGDAIYTANVEDGGFPCQLILRDALQKLYVYTWSAPP